MAHTPATRQRVLVSLQTADGRTFQSGVFWVQAGDFFSPLPHARPA